MSDPVDFGDPDFRCPGCSVWLSPDLSECPECGEDVRGLGGDRAVEASEIEALIEYFREKDEELTLPRSGRTDTAWAYEHCADELERLLAGPGTQLNTDMADTRQQAADGPDVSHADLVGQAEAVVEATRASMYWPVAHGEAARLQEMIENRTDDAPGDVVFECYVNGLSAEPLATTGARYEDVARSSTRDIVERVAVLFKSEVQQRCRVVGSGQDDPVVVDLMVRLGDRKVGVEDHEHCFSWCGGEPDEDRLYHGIESVVESVVRSWRGDAA